MLPNIDNNKGDKRVLVECQCHGFHYLQVSRWGWNDGEVQYCVEFIADTSTLWQAIKWWWKHKKSWVGEIIITEADRKAIIEALQDPPPDKDAPLSSNR